MTTSKTSIEGSGAILTKLEAALNSDGDFPVRARVVMELRQHVDDPNTPIEKIVEIILGEPSLGTRVLHLVNSVFYLRRQPVMTISQAVMQLGMRALTDLCTGLVLLQRFSPVARRGGIFADNVKKSILTSILTAAFARELGDKDEERGYLAGTFFSIGPLLLAYYFPQVIESAQKRAQRRNQTTTQSVTETLGIAPVALSLGIIDALAIPEFYREVMIAAYHIFVNEEREAVDHEHSGLAQALAAAGMVADALIDTNTRPELQLAMDEVLKETPLNAEQLDRVLSMVPESFRQQCRLIEMTFLTLPEHFLTYLETRENPEIESVEAVDSRDDEFSYYVDEIKEAVRNQETLSSVITTVMEALAFGLKFDRVMLLFADPKGASLQGRMSLGQPFTVKPQDFSRSLEAKGQERSPETLAFNQGTVETFGDPLFPDGWPFAAIPIGGHEHVVGVLYADKIDQGPTNAVALTDQTQVALTILADLLDQALAVNGVE
ncbi:MAG: HDOD domain-containing protein [Bdellovibrionales bacterium]|nr:HDOD domain-containing protein [Bdellovibrionales bacterium]